MIVDAYSEQYRDGFLQFCRLNRPYLDDSYLSDDELRSFRGDWQDPTFLLIDDDGTVMGAASLLWNDYMRRQNRARFRIFGCQSPEPKHYARLWERVIHWAPDELQALFLFIPQENSNLRKRMAHLGFTIERYSFLLERRQQALSPVLWPPGYDLRQFRRGLDEQDVVDVRNAAFRRLQGSSTPITTTSLQHLLDSVEHLAGGILLLYYDDSPVGVVRASREWHRGSDWLYIGMLAVVPEHQGKGLGRMLLRAALATGEFHGLFNSLLTVNAENKQAVRLYLTEGFNVNNVMECWTYLLGQGETSG